MSNVKLEGEIEMKIRKICFKPLMSNVKLILGGTHDERCKSFKPLMSNVKRKKCLTMKI